MNSQTTSPKQRRDEDRKSVQASLNTFSRVIAVMVLMLSPGLVGYFLDNWIGTQFLMVVGFAIGIILAVFGLILVVKRANQELRKKP